LRPTWAKKKKVSETLSQRLNQDWWHISAIPAMWDKEVGRWDPRPALKPYLKNKLKIKVPYDPIT
jgi:hypothetical protein